MCRGINWERQPLEELATIADCVGGAGLAALCLLLAQDHSGWGGAPAVLPLSNGFAVLFWGWLSRVVALGPLMQDLGRIPYVRCAGGMPDLLLWRPSDRRAKLSEVKGPRDRLSEQQRAWAAALSGAGLQVLLSALVDVRSAWRQ